MGRMSTKKAILAIVTSLLSIGIIMGSNLFPAKLAWAKESEIGANEVKGKVMEISTRFRKGTLVVKSDKTGKTYTFSLGVKTIYIPHRYPIWERPLKYSTSMTGGS